MGNEPLNPPYVKGSKLAIGRQWLRDPYAFLDATLARCGPTFYLPLPVAGDALVTGDPAWVADICSNRKLIGGRGNRALRHVLGPSSLILLEGEEHAMRRRAIAPRFRDRAAAHYDALTVQCTRDEIQRLVMGGPFAMLDVARRITLRVVVRMLFGQIPPAMETEVMGLVDAVRSSFKHPLFLFVEALHWDLGRLTPWGRLVRNRERLRTFVMTERNRRQKRELNADGGLLEDLVSASHRDTSLHDDAIFSEILSLLLFGHDTTAVTLAWVFYHVYSHEHVLTQLQREVDADTGSQTDYLDACICESMRLCPAVVHLTRVAACDCVIGGHSIKAGGRVFPCTYLAQRNPAAFAQPHLFRPERFLRRDLRSHDFFPFGLGDRRCIGEHLARRQMRLILQTFVRESRLVLDAPRAAKPVREMLIVGPANGAMMRMLDA